MTAVFEPGSSATGGDRSANCATTTARHFRTFTVSYLVRCSQCLIILCCHFKYSILQYTLNIKYVPTYTLTFRYVPTYTLTIRYVPTYTLNIRYVPTYTKRIFSVITFCPNQTRENANPYNFSHSYKFRHLSVVSDCLYLSSLSLSRTISVRFF